MEHTTAAAAALQMMCRSRALGSCWVKAWKSAVSECAMFTVQVIRFPEAVETAVEELMPNRITDYLYDLSEKFNGFYTECHVRS